MVDQIVAVPPWIVGQRHPRFGHARTARPRGRERDAEVRDERMSRLQQDILRLDVAVDHAVCVRVCQRVGDLACETVAQAFAVDERHYVEHRLVHRA
ncbi:MAG: hypothetical protein ABI625_10040 [bacterium]